MSKRDAILKAAEPLVVQHGPAATSVDAVISRAGVTPRTLYRWFPGKSDLVAAVLHGRRERFETALDVALDQRSGAAVPALLGEIARWARAAPASGCPFLRAGAEAAGAIAILEAVAAYRDGLQTRLKKACDLDRAIEGAAALELLAEGLIARSGRVEDAHGVSAVRLWEGRNGA